MPNEVEFPEGLLDTLVDRLGTIQGVSNVYKRELEPTDPNGSIGVSFELWQPVLVEMGGGGFDPSLSDYTVQIEHLVKHAHREEGSQVHRTLARSIRSMLYRDEATQLAFRQLAFVGPEYRERLMKWHLEQRFAQNKIANAFYFVSGTTVTFQTETI